MPGLRIPRHRQTGNPSGLLPEAQAVCRQRAALHSQDAPAACSKAGHVSSKCAQRKSKYTQCKTELHWVYFFCRRMHLDAEAPAKNPQAPADFPEALAIFPQALADFRQALQTYRRPDARSDRTDTAHSACGKKDSIPAPEDLRGDAVDTWSRPCRTATALRFSYGRRQGWCRRRH